MSKSILGVYSNLKLRISRNELIKDSFWALLGNFFGKGLSFAAGIYVARLLGSEVFGEYGMIRNTVVSMSILSTFGLGYTATKFIADSRNLSKNKLIGLVKTVNKITWFSSGILTLLVLLFAREIATIAFRAEHLSNSLRIVAFLILFNALTTTQVGVLSGFGEFKKMAKWTAVVGVFTFLVCVLLTFKYGLNGALLGLLSSQIFNWIIFESIIRNHLRAIVKKDSEASKSNTMELIKFSIPVAMQEVSYSILSWVTSYVFIRYSSYEEFGVYNAGMQISVMILFIPGILRNVFLSHLSFSVKDIDSNNRVLKHTILINLVSTIVPVVIVLIFLNPIRGMFGTKFSNLSSVIVLLALNTIPMSIINVYTQSFISRGKNWVLFWVKLIKDLLIIILFIGIPVISVSHSEALSISLLFTNLLFVVIMFLLNKNKNYVFKF